MGYYKIKDHIDRNTEDILRCSPKNPEFKLSSLFVTCCQIICFMLLITAFDVIDMSNLTVLNKSIIFTFYAVSTFFILKKIMSWFLTDCVYTGKHNKQAMEMIKHIDDYHYKNKDKYCFLIKFFNYLNIDFFNEKADYSDKLKLFLFFKKSLENDIDFKNMELISNFISKQNDRKNNQQTI